MQKVEIRVRPVVRYIVTRWVSDENCAGSETLGEFDNEWSAQVVAAALEGTPYAGRGTAIPVPE